MANGEELGKKAGALLGRSEAEDAIDAALICLAADGDDILTPNTLGVPERMRSDRLVDRGTAGHPAHDPSSTVAAHALAVSAQEDWAGQALADGHVTARAVRGASCTVTTLYRETPLPSLTRPGRRSRGCAPYLKDTFPEPVMMRS